jgi:N-acetylglucosaminyldiphosphoundecaprenol N-acetyl-beta-D-mannosaminyltransferase
MQRINMLNCSIAKVTMPEVISLVESYVRNGTFHLGFGINADLAVKMNESREFKDIIHKSDIIFADGMSVVIASRLLRKSLPERIGAIELFEALLPIATEKQFKIFLLGTKDNILEKAVDCYHFKYPGIKISGFHNGYWSPNEEDSIIDKINMCSPDLLFLGISSPKREQFIDKNRSKFKSVSFALGVGGTFDIHAGKFTRAPIWIQKIGLEWFWRLLQEPRRMFWRYTVNNIKFIYLVLKDIMKSTQYHTVDDLI